MRRTITGMVAIVSLMMMMFFASVPPASATRPVTYNFEITSVTDSDIVVKVVSEQVTQFSWTEVITYQGEQTGQATWAMKANVVKWEHYTMEAFGIFEGAILGRTGTAMFHASVTVWLGGNTQWSLSHIEEDVIFGGTGGLEGIHGTCTVAPHTATLVGVCSVHFE